MTTREGPPNGQGLPPTQAEGSGGVVTVTDVRQITVTEIHQETGSVGTAHPSANPQLNNPQLEPVVSNKSTEPRLRLVDETGQPIIPTRTERKVRQAFRREKKEANEARNRKKQVQKLVNLLVDFASVTESRKIAEQEMLAVKEARGKLSIQNPNQPEGGETKMVEKETIETAVPATREKLLEIVDARIRPKTGRIGKVLGHVIGQAKKDKVEIQGFANKAENAAKVSENAAKRAEDAAAKTEKKSSKSKFPTWIVAGVLGAAAMGLATWGVMEITDNDGKDSIVTTGGIHTMQMGETYTVPANSIVTGDVLAKIDGELMRLYDNDPTTGLIVKVLLETEFAAPYGATVQTNLLPESMDKLIEQDRQTTLRARPEITVVDQIDVVAGKQPQLQGQS